MRDIISNRLLTDKQIKHIEEAYGAKYLIDSCLRTTDGQWVDYPAAFFYTKEPHPEGSNYFAIFYQYGQFQASITNGICIEDQILAFAIVDSGMFHSRYHHEYVERDGVFIDGGQDYVRTSSDNLVNYRIENGEFVED